MAVAYVSERGVACVEAGNHYPHFCVESAMPLARLALIKHHLEPEIYSFRALDNLVGRVRVSRRSYELPDSHQNRHGDAPLGLSALRNELGALSLRLKHEPRVKVVGVLSHLSAADDPEHDHFTRLQIAQSAMAVLICANRPPGPSNAAPHLQHVSLASLS